MQNSNMNALAKKLNSMQNPIVIGPSIGKVIKKSPLTISIAGGKVTLTKGEELEICEGLANISPAIEKDDKIFVVPAADEQTWVAVDRIYEE